MSTRPNTTHHFSVTPVVLPLMSELQRMRLDEQMRVRASCGAFNRPSSGVVKDRMHFATPPSDSLQRFRENIAQGIKKMADLMNQWADNLNELLGHGPRVSVKQMTAAMTRDSDEYFRLMGKLEYWRDLEMRLHRAGYEQRLAREGNAYKTNKRYFHPTGDDARFVRWCMADENVSTLRGQLRALIFDTSIFDKSPNVL